MSIVAAADGSALGNPGPAGWAWVVDEDHWRSGGWPRATNNQGELMAVLDLLQSTAHRADEQLHILCDSKYVIDSVTKWMPGWKRKGWRKADGKPVLNRELLEGIDQALVGRQVTFEWVKGHAGHPMNEAADAHARAAATAFQRGQAPDSGPGLGNVVSTPPQPAQAEASSGQPAQFESTLFDLDAPIDPVSEAVANEQSLLSPAVRANRKLVDSLLHPGFREIGVSGKLWDRASMVDALIANPAYDGGFSLIAASTLSDDIVQVVYRSGGSRPAVRTSLWKLDGGAFRLFFHQGTPATSELS